MSRALITESYLTDIANAIRAKLGVQDTYTPPQMAAAIESIPTGGITPTGTKNITQNGTHDVTQYASANVNVQPTLQSKTATQNGTVTPDQGYDGLSEVVVNVSGGGSLPGVYKGSSAPSSDTGVDGDLYIREYALPNNVSFVEYLENSGTQYIDSGVTGDKNTRVFCKFKFHGDENVLGGRESASSRTITITGVSSSAYSLDFGTNRNQASATVNDVVEAETGNLFKTAYGEIVAASAVSSFTTPVTIKLFATHATNSYGLAVASIATIYRATFRQDGIVIKDFLPAIDGNGVACMYEAISGNYCYNAGTGDFTYGSSYTPKAAQTLYKKIGGTWKIINQTGAIA